MATSGMAEPSGEHVVFWRRLADEIASGVPPPTATFMSMF